MGSGRSHCFVKAAIKAALASCNEEQRSSGGAGVCRITRLGNADVVGLTGMDWTESVERYRDRKCLAGPYPPIRPSHRYWPMAAKRRGGTSYRGNGAVRSQGRVFD
jgi:hypothetical protein